MYAIRSYYGSSGKHPEAELANNDAGHLGITEMTASDFLRVGLQLRFLAPAQGLETPV